MQELAESAAAVEAAEVRLRDMSFDGADMCAKQEAARRAAATASHVRAEAEQGDSRMGGELSVYSYSVHDAVLPSALACLLLAPGSNRGTSRVLV